MSRIRTNLITNRMANGAPTVSNGLVISGVTTSTTFSGSGASLTNLNASNIASGTVPTARLGSGTASSSTFLAGDSTYKTVTGTTINNNADNRVITGSGTANTLEGESQLLFTGTNLGVGNRTSSPDERLHVHTSSGQANIHVEGATDGQIILRSHGGDSVIHFGDAGATSVGKILYDHGTDSLQFTTNSNERLRIASDGKSYFVGANSGGFHATTLPNGNTVNINTKTSNDGLSVIRYSSSYGPYGLNIGRSKSETLGTNALVANGDDLGHITWYGADGSDFNQAAAITVQVDGTPSNGTDMPGRIIFKTTPDGSGTPVERMRINSTGQVTKPSQASFAAVNTSNAYSLNSQVFPFNATTHNVGSHFNTSNYRFTAPISGRYLFTFYSIFNTSGQGRYEILINGSAGQMGTRVHMNNSNTNWDNTSTCWILDLSANDYIQMYSQTNTGWHGNHWQRFCGELLS